MTIISTPAELTPIVLNKAVGRYYRELQDYTTQADHELALRPAFQNLLAEMARKINLTLVHEMTIRGRIRPDGVLCDAFHIQRGYWEAKGPRGNLEDEIRQKIKDGYPLENALFENTRQAVLYQAGQRYDFDLQVQADATALLKRFLTYQKPDIANFEQAVVEFQGQIPNIAKRLLELINEEQQRNARFVAAFNTFADLCRTTLNPKIGADEIREMLIQHLLTERLFRTVFDNPDFVSKNAIAAEIERVIAALTSRSFNRSAFMRSLDPFYGAIEAAVIGLCFDTGHYRFGGGDPVQGLRRHADRVWHVHFKDHDSRIAEQSRRNDWDAIQSVEHGVFCELGKGDVNFPAVIQELKDIGYDGWIVVEQDVLPGMGTPKESAQRNRDYLRSIGL